MGVSSERLLDFYNLYFRVENSCIWFVFVEELHKKILNFFYFGLSFLIKKTFVKENLYAFESNAKSRIKK